MRQRAPASVKQALADVTVVFADRPTKADLAAGVPPDALSCAAARDGHITLYLMNLYERYAGKYREQLHLLLQREL